MVGLAIVSMIGGASCSLSPKPIRMPTIDRPTGDPPTVLAFLKDSESLARSGMNYRFGGESPEEGGFDCSGTIHYLLQRQGYRNLPRQANHFYQWLDQAGTLVKTSGRDPEKVYTKLHAGDLLFWKGTYKTRRRPNVTHVMIYMGYDHNKREHVMFGARGTKANGRNGNGVDLHRFVLGQGKGKFVGYGSIPGLVRMQRK